MYGHHCCMRGHTHKTCPDRGAAYPAIHPKKNQKRESGETNMGGGKKNVTAPRCGRGEIDQPPSPIPQHGRDGLICGDRSCSRSQFSASPSRNARFDNVHTLSIDQKNPKIYASIHPGDLISRVGSRDGTRLCVHELYMNLDVRDEGWMYVICDRLHISMQDTRGKLAIGPQRSRVEPLGSSDQASRFPLISSHRVEMCLADDSRVPKVLPTSHIACPRQRLNTRRIESRSRLGTSTV